MARYRKYRRRRKRRSGKVSKSVKRYVQKSIRRNIETKVEKDNQSPTVIAGSGYLYFGPGESITQGLTIRDRIGAEIRLGRFNLNLHLNPDVATINAYRVVCGYTTNTGAEMQTLFGTLNSGYPANEFPLSVQHDYSQIIPVSDRVYTCDPIANKDKMIKIKNWNMKNRKLEYTALATTPLKCAWQPFCYVYVDYSTGSTTPKADFSWQQSFKDA